MSEDEHSPPDERFEHLSFGALLHPGTEPSDSRPAPGAPREPVAAPPSGPIGPGQVATPPPLTPVLFPPAPSWTPRVEGTWEPPTRRRSRKKWLALVLVAALVSAGVVVALEKPWESKYPSAWDARVAPIAAKVADLRGLEFQHPVHVRFLPEQEFEARIAIDQSGLDGAAKQGIEDGEAELRALGLIGGDVDLLAAFDRAQTSSTIAYYDPNEEEIFVRGETLDVAHRVTIAHELTHVLQDQHFDLLALREQAERSEKGDSGALDAIIEGDAVRIEDEYLADLSPAEQNEWSVQNTANIDRVDIESAGVPEILKLQLGAPYVFGSYTIRVRVADGGNESVDGALNGRPLSARMYVEPGELTAVPVDPPALPRGAVLAAPHGSVSSFDVYVMLAARGDAQAALRAADVVVGGRYIAYRVDEGPYCVQVALATQGSSGRSVVLGALESWTATRPGATVGKRGDDVTFTACDPGTQAGGPPPENIVAAGELLALRGELTAQLAEEGAAPAQARCVARLVVRRTDLIPILLSEQDPPVEQQRALFDAFGAGGFACAANEYAGLDQV